MIKGIVLFVLVLMTNLAIAQNGKGLEALPKGSIAPAFSAKNQFDKIVNSKDLLSSGSVVLIFYRGAWCPYCKKHIHKMQEGFQHILSENASVVVVTPEKPEYIEKMISKTKAQFSILHDEDYKIMEDYHVKYTIKKEDKMAFKGYVLQKTKKHNAADEAVLPVPATYIISPDGKIKYVHFDTNYKKRASLEDILKELKTK